jgi:hypothetical protein
MVVLRLLGWSLSMAQGQFLVKEGVVVRGEHFGVKVGHEHHGPVYPWHEGQFWSKYKDRASLYCGHTAGQYDLISNTII